MMAYRIEVYDRAGLRAASFDDVPLIEATASTPDQPSRVRGMLPAALAGFGPGYVLRVYVDGVLFLEAPVTRAEPQWGDTRKLVADRYVTFHEVLEFEAVRPAYPGNAAVTRAYANRRADAIVRDAINAALGPVHYTVEHGAYPEGAEREFAKFVARQHAGNELEVGGIEAGQWVGAPRLDASGAYAVDGDTIGGLVVDGEAWPHLRLMMIDAEETSKNSHAVARHPEVAGWTTEQYNASGYKLRADAAKQALEDLIDAHGISDVELNPHRDAAGQFDDRVDAFGRYIGLVYGGGQCFNAAQVEQGHADVYLYADGRDHVHEMALKEYFSYTGPHADSIEPAPALVEALDVSGGLYELLTALAYLAGGYGWDLGPTGTVRFREADRVDHVAAFDPVRHAAGYGAAGGPIVNSLRIGGNPLATGLSVAAARHASIAAFGEETGTLAYFSLSHTADAERMAAALLDDLAYPATLGALTVFDGDPALRPGDVIELRGEPIRRYDTPIDGEWGGRFAGRLVGRVHAVTHRFTGRIVTTEAELAAPLRSVGNPLAVIVRGQPEPGVLFQFRLDDDAIGLDTGVHLD